MSQDPMRELVATSYKIQKSYAKLNSRARTQAIRSQDMADGRRMVLAHAEQMLRMLHEVVEHVEGLEVPEHCPRCSGAAHDGACIVPYRQEEHGQYDGTGLCSRFTARDIGGAFWARSCRSTARQAADHHPKWFHQGECALLCDPCVEDTRRTHPQLLEPHDG